MEGGSTERHQNIQTCLTEPQGKLKKVLFRVSVKTVARNEMEGGSTERHRNIQTCLTEPQGKLKKLILGCTLSRIGGVAHQHH